MRPVLAIILTLPLFGIALLGVMLDLLKYFGNCVFNVANMVGQCAALPALDVPFSYLYSAQFLAGVLFIFGPGWILQVLYLIGLAVGMYHLWRGGRKVTAGKGILVAYLVLPLLPLITHPVFGVKHTWEKANKPSVKQSPSSEATDRPKPKMDKAAMKAERLKLPAHTTRYVCPTPKYEIYIDVDENPNDDGSLNVFRLSEMSDRSPLGKIKGKILDFTGSGIPNNPNTPFMKQLRAKDTCRNAKGEPFSARFDEMKF